MRLALLCLLLSFSMGCIKMVRPQATSIPFEPESMELTGAARGETESITILGLISVDVDGEFSTQVAAEKALAKSGGDFLLNPTVDVETRSFLGIMTTQVIRVSGQSARFKNRPLQTKPLGTVGKPEASGRAENGLSSSKPRP